MHGDTAFSVGDLPDFSADPAHLFMQLYDRLPDDLFADRTPAVWLDDPEVRRRAARVERDVLARGTAEPDRLARIVRWSGDRGLFTLLRGLDGALWYVNPFSPTIDRGALDWLAVRYAMTGLLNDEKVIAGALLPRCALAGKPRGAGHKGDYFSVHRVPPEHLTTKIQYKLLEARYQPAFEPELPVKVACAPLLENFDELKLTFGDDPAGGAGRAGRARPATYRLAPADPLPDLDARIRALIDAMDAAGARIAVMPEGCLSDDLFERWRRIACGTARRDKPLRWLLLGSGPLDGGDPPTNRAVLLDRWTGETLLTHDKLERFTLDAEQVRTWQLPDGPDRGRVEEDITVGSTVAVRDSSLGRLAVLICEDLAASTTWERELISMGVSHLLVPIFSKPILRHRWEQQAAERQVSLLGAWVVVSNSLATATAMSDALGEDWYTCLVMGPADPQRSRWGYDTQLGRARTADDLGWITTEDTHRRLPTVLAGAVRASWFGRSPVPGGYHS
jgi:predicted amidohydrolase